METQFIPATTRQKAQILLLLNSEEITTDEKNRMIMAINKLSKPRADQAIKSLQETLAKRRLENTPKLLKVDLKLEGHSIEEICIALHNVVADLEEGKKVNVRQDKQYYYSYKLEGGDNA